MTSEQLFLRYAWPCADGRLMRHLVSETDYAELEHLVAAGVKPPRSLLRRCFPDAYASLRKFAKESGQALWSMAAVTSYWREQHGHEGDCRVLSGVVRRINGRRVVVELAPGKAYNCLNLYNLSLTRGGMIYLHRRVIIELKSE